MPQTQPTLQQPNNVASQALTGPIEGAIEAYAANFAAVLPPDIPLDHFKRIVLTAVSTAPELQHADRRSFFNSCIRCASDGLLPDGRDAALVVYRTKVKDRRTKQERYVDLVQYLPMIGGIRRRMRNTGEVKSATAETVHRNDEFDYELGDEPFIKHKPPPLGEERGEIIGCYARIELANGEVLRDVMSIADVERARGQSRAPNSLMWTKFYSEGAKKTVLRRCGKAAPTASTLQALLNRDDESPLLPPPDQMQLVPPRPVEEDFEEETGEVIDDGSVSPETPAEAQEGHGRRRGRPPKAAASVDAPQATTEVDQHPPLLYPERA